ncbi:MAG TPA: 50S ribosomal protein L29 [Candidatus Krumholzibacteria bacterium]|nr:50S ribosomal protein L29 [Candidatus Krumholzibacteria bacterium]
MKAQELKNMTIEELEAHKESLLDEMAGLRVKLVLRQLDNPLRVRLLRKDIARARTVIRQKQIAAK